MRILVTGGTGFLGRHLVHALLEQDHQVRALGRNKAVCRELEAAGAEVVRADLRDAQAVQLACADIDAVCHVGALSAAWGRAADFHAINVGGTANVIAGCQLHGLARLVYVSSPSVVFDGRELIDAAEAAPYPRRYLATYSLTKKLGEDLVNEAHRTGLATVIIRPKAIFGPGDTSLLPKLLGAARRGRLPQIGDGSNLVDLTYVDNVVHSLVLALTAERAVGNTYTITNDEHVRLWDAIRMFLGRLDLDTDLRRVPYRLAYSLAAGMEWRARLFGGEPFLTRYTAAILAKTQTYNISAARRDLGYAPQVSVAEGIERTLASLHHQVCHV
jgi:nucleoside-diphosphate-sugar epimerase